MHKSIYLIGVLLLALTIAACDSVDSGTFSVEYVVESYLVAGEPLQQVRLSRTTPINQAYEFSDLAVGDARVEIQLLGPGGEVDERYAFVPAEDTPGVYRPVEQDVRALPLRTYRLNVEVPGADPITSTTVVPDTFRVVSANADTVVFQSTDQLEIEVSLSSSPGRSQSYYIAVTEALDARKETLTPFAKSVYERSDGDVSIENLRVSGSPILNQDNYDLNPNNTLTIRYPWLGVAFYGPNRVSLNAIDDNLYDFIRSQSVQQGGSTFSPGEIPNPIERVAGARGVFGSYARIFYDVYVLRPSSS